MTLGSRTKLEDVPGSDTQITRVLFLLLSLPMALAIGGSRWFSKLSIGPIFALDVFLIPALLSGLALLWIFRRQFSLKSLISFAVLMVIPGLTVVRIIGHEVPTAATMRDAYPFLILTYGAIAGLALSLGNRRIFKDLTRLLCVALVIHWSWVSWIMLAIQVEDLHALSSLLRADLDGMLIGALAAVLMLFPAPTFAWNTAVVFVSIGMVTQVSHLGSRAALLATVLMVGVAAVIRLRSSNPVFLRNRKKLLIAPMTVLMVGITLGLASSESLAQKFVGLFEVTTTAAATVGADTGKIKLDKQAVDGSGDIGTTLARVNSWRHLVDYTTSRQALWVGFGPGSNYFHESGAAAILLGKDASNKADASRHPHNFLLHSTAMLGLPSALGLSALLVGAWVLGFRRGAEDTNSQISVVLLIGYTVTSLFGVVFEGPYGALPISWTLGLLWLMTRPTSLPRRPAPGRGMS